MDMRPAAKEEFGAFLASFNRAMGFGPPSDEYVERFRALHVPERSLAAFDRGQVVGTAYSHLFELTVPGPRQVDVAGVTAVGVQPTHRRRGILSELMRRQLAEARDRGEPMAILIASESIIYNRYGYGPSSYVCDYEIDRRDAALREPFRGEGLFLVDEGTADKVFPEVHERFRKQQPGAIPRTEAWWANMRAENKPGTESLLIHEDASGNVDGFARYVKKAHWEHGLPASNLDVTDLIATTDEAKKALWSHVLDVDLVRTVRAWARAVDESVRWWLANPRALRVTRVGDFVWTRLLDIPASLAARRYRADAELTVEVSDPQFEENNRRFALSISEGAASCEPSTAGADLSLGVDALGSLYLGGVAASDLAAAGRIRELTDGALAKADAAFSSSPKPWSSTWF